MDKQSLEVLLAQGVSIERIAKRFGRDPSSISYWMKKYGLESPYRERHAAKGGIERDQLEKLVEAGASITKIAECLGRSHGTVRHWLAKYGLETRATVRRRAAAEARAAGQLRMKRDCAEHGRTDFLLEGRGVYRCLLCRQERVTRRRRAIKAMLVQEAGGRCCLCGYARCVGALHFHHRDPGEKSFALSQAGVARSLERNRTEARKCVLLCSNCHAEVESGMASIPRLLAA